MHAHASKRRFTRKPQQHGRPIPIQTLSRMAVGILSSCFLWSRQDCQPLPDNVKRHLSRRQLSILILFFQFYFRWWLHLRRRNALSLKRHLFPHGGRVKCRHKDFWIDFLTLPPHLEYYFNSSSSTLKRDLILSDLCKKVQGSRRPLKILKAD